MSTDEPQNPKPCLCKEGIRESRIKWLCTKIKETVGIDLGIENFEFSSDVYLFDEVETLRLVDQAIAWHCNLEITRTNAGSLPSRILLPNCDANKKIDPLVTDVVRSKRDFYVSGARRERSFQVLASCFDDIATTHFADILACLDKPEVIKEIISYGNAAKIDWVDVDSCPLCSSTAMFKKTGGEFSTVHGYLLADDLYVECADCQHISLNWSVKNGSQLAYFYNETTYFRGIPSSDFDRYMQNLGDKSVPHFRNYQTCCSEMRLSAGASLLDVGGGVGEFAYYAKKLYPDAEIAIAEWYMPAVASDFLRANDLMVITGDVLKILRESPTESRDVITAWEVVEHFRPEDIKIFFEGVARALKPDGEFYLSTPDYDSPFSNALDFWAAFPGEHLSIFNRANVIKLAADVGLINHFCDSESVSLRPVSGWYSHGSRIERSRSTAGQCFLIDALLDHGVIENWRNQYKRQFDGSEMILGFRKS